MIEAEMKVEHVEFERDKLSVQELDEDEDIITSVQIRLEGEEILVFISDYHSNLHCKRIPYTEFREKLTEMIDDPKTGKPI